MKFKNQVQFFLFITEDQSHKSQILLNPSEHQCLYLPNGDNISILDFSIKPHILDIVGVQKSWLYSFPLSYSHVFNLHTFQKNIPTINERLHNRKCGKHESGSKNYIHNSTLFADDNFFCNSHLRIYALILDRGRERER